MILGAVSFSFESETGVAAQRLQKTIEDHWSTDEIGYDRDPVFHSICPPPGNREICFHPVTARGFTGGFFTHPRLPYTPGACLYTSPEGDILVLLSGNIYNPAVLLSDGNPGTNPVTGKIITESTLPSQPGITGVPSSLPALIARAFLAEGPSFVNRLNGDFALFILLPDQKEAYLFRDHVGIQPLGWHYAHHTLSFSSDMLALCRAIEPSGQPNPDYLLSYFKYTDLRTTPYHGVKKLLPGHYLHFTPEGPRVVRYWTPETIQPDPSFTRENLLSDLHTLVRDAVAIRCDRRFTAAAHVSSGIDSGVVAALARPCYAHQNPFHGFSWSPENSNYSSLKFDEREIITRFCTSAGIDAVFNNMDLPAFLKCLDRFYFNQGYFNEEQILEQAASHQVNLLFSGWGGDEFISTGDRGIDSDLLFRGHWRLFFRRNPLFPLKSFLRDQLSYIILPALGIIERGTSRGFRDEARYLRKPWKKSAPHALRNYYFYTSRRQLHLRLLRHGFLQERTESWAINGFRHGVEYRYPLLDRRIIETMLKVPSELLAQFSSFRPLLREITPPLLPEEIRWHWDKHDPAAMALDRSLFREAALHLMKEAPAWKCNPALKYFDFKLLERDIALCRAKPDHPRFRHDTSKPGFDILARTLVYMKAIHAFSRDYGSPEFRQDH